MVDMTKYEKHSVNNYIEEFRVRLGNVVQNILEIGEIYVEACQRYSNAKAKFKAAFPGVRDASWEKFEAIGKHKLAASAFFLNSSFAFRLMKHRVPVKTQERMVSETGVNVYRKDEGKTVCVPFSEFTVADEEVVFNAATGKIRTDEEQKVFAETPKVKSSPLYEARDGGVQVNGKCFLSWDRLVEISGGRIAKVTEGV